MVKPFLSDRAKYTIETVLLRVITLFSDRSLSGMEVAAGLKKFNRGRFFLFIYMARRLI